MRKILTVHFDFLAINSAGGKAPFSVATSSITTSSITTSSITTSNNLVTLTGTAPVQVKTIKVNGIEYAVTWTTLTDWILRVPVHSASNTLMIQSCDLR